MFFLIFALNIDCWYTLEPRTHDLCFGSKIRKIGIPCIPQFYCIKVGVEVVYTTRTCFPDVLGSVVIDRKARCIIFKNCMPLSHIIREQREGFQINTQLGFLLIYDTPNTLSAISGV